MDGVLLLIAIILIAIFVFFLGGIFAEPICSKVRRWIPSFSYDGEWFLLAGLGFLTAFALGLMVMYLLLKH